VILIWSFFQRLKSMAFSLAPRQKGLPEIRRTDAPSLSPTEGQTIRKVHRHTPAGCSFSDGTDYHHKAMPLQEVNTPTPHFSV
jgi:hypothetical protein